MMRIFVDRRFFAININNKHYIAVVAKKVSIHRGFLQGVFGICFSPFVWHFNIHDSCHIFCPFTIFQHEFSIVLITFCSTGNFFNNGELVEKVCMKNSWANLTIFVHPQQIKPFWSLFLGIEEQNTVNNLWSFCCALLENIKICQNC